MSKPKLHVKKGDEVRVIAGKDKGRQGEILKVIPTESRVVVEGVNIIKKHAQPTQDNPQGGIIEREAPIHSSNVMLVCQDCNEATRTGKKVLDSGEKVRYCKNCDEIVD
ncbi:ribosomal protein L24, bacterial/organelle [Halobacteroides halobius DSM 5150]|uniref:Large ribosomal subunit protein uL24 n=1 Tax=Halobacteroides halobius (strain ATCC 35273 / DSM 5150 / MD-1) TaxID=748449 RepID=L0K4L2_HALHC|nr:50S ribosomal protein L24 [Halobacteroides halobius]AGB40212.1 ribosomal protein L24, bacterial/organelle [Halobacteroides halobius DSM 5150]